MIEAPPLSAGADQETTAWVFAGVPTAPVGELGAVRGVASDDDALVGLIPSSFVADTEIV